MKNISSLIYNSKFYIQETDPDVLTISFTNFLNSANFTIIDSIAHHFSPQGFTVIWLLAESHLALHTFPEHNKTYIEISSCSIESYNNFLEIVAQQYKIFPF